MNKSDRADPVVTQQWIDYFQAEHNIKARAVSQEQPTQIKQTLQLCRQLFPNRNTAIKPVQVMIIGIPNVGKSSIINTLSGRIIAKVGNEPAVTKRQQKIILENGIQLMDTPGFLWPKIHNPNSGYRLAITGAIKSTAMEYDDVALFAADYFLTAYPDILMQRYKLNTLPENDMDVLESIGKKRGCLQAGGKINLHKASELLINEFRTRQLGAISLETPQMTEEEMGTIQTRKEETKN